MSMVPRLQNLTFLLIAVLVLVVAFRLVSGKIRHTSAGEYVYVQQDKCQTYDREASFDGDERPIAIQMFRDGSMKLNQDALLADDFAQHVSRVFAPRCRRAAYIIADPDLPFATVAARIGELHASVPYLHIVIVTNPNNPCGLAIRHWREMKLADCDAPQRLNN